MGTPTNEYVRVVRNTNKGDDHFGTCDQCGKPCSEHWVSQGKRIWQRSDGTKYLSNANSGGAYGHLSCLIRQFGPQVSQASLKRDKNILLWGGHEVIGHEATHKAINGIRLASTEQDPLLENYAQES